MGESILDVEHLSAGYGGTQVLWDITLHVDREELVAVLGSNGSGKTTLLNTIAGVVPCHKSSTIVLNGNEIQSLPASQRVERGLALVPEGRRLFSYLDVKTNLELGAYTKRARNNLSDSLEFVYGIFPILKERQRQTALSLSGGEQKMLSIGRALMSQPEIILLDEPSAGLAPVTANKIFESLVDLSKEGLTLLLAEQSVIGEVELTNRAYVLAKGSCVMEGPSQSLMTNSEVKKVYLGL